MAIGLLLENEIVARLLVMGVKVLHRGDIFTAKDLPVVVHPDGFYANRLEIVNGIIVVHPSDKLRLLEIKTMGHERYLECYNFGIANTRHDLVGQVQLYLEHAGKQLGATEGDWLVMDRDQPDNMFVESFRHDSAIVNALSEKIIIAKDSVDRQLEPEALSCSNDFLDRLLCPWQHLCGKIPTEISNPVLEIAAKRFLDCKLVIDEMNSMIEVSRATIEAIMESRGLSSIKGYGISATSGEQYRTNTDTILAKQILPRDVYDRIFTSKVISMLRIERERNAK